MAPEINVAQAPESRAGKAIEEREQILLHPELYIGPLERKTQTLWVYESKEMVKRYVTYVHGLYKIFDEILVNVADNKQRDPSMDSLKVVIDVEQNLISVFNNGVPDSYGAKLTNIFSTEFIIEISDGKEMKKYKQNNLVNKSEPVITKCNKGENWTRVTFIPDLKKFNMTELENDVVALMSKRVFDIAGCLGKSVKVELNDKLIPVKSFTVYVDLYLRTANKSRTDPLPRIVEKNDRWELCVSLSDGQFQQVSFVNSIATIEGGTHVDYVTSQITDYIVGIVNKKNKPTNVKAHNVQNQLWIFVNTLIDNPTFNSQTKEALTLQQSSFGSNWKLSKDILKKVEKLISWTTSEQKEELKRSDGTKARIVELEDLVDAYEGGVIELQYVYVDCDRRKFS